MLAALMLDVERRARAMTGQRPVPLTAILRRLVRARVLELGSQRAVAIELGVDHVTVYRWLNSDRDISGPMVDLLVDRFGRERIARELQR